MNQKQAKFYDSLLAFGKSDYLKDDAALNRVFSFLIDYSYDTAAEFWEYLISKNKMETKPAAEKIGNDVFEVFAARNLTKAMRMLFDSNLFMAAYFTYNPDAYKGPCDMILNLLISNKLTQAEMGLTYLAKNTASDRSYPEMLRKIIDGAIARALSKADGEGAVNLHKKQHALMKSFVLKLKGPDKPLLEQKLKELAPTDIYGD